MTIEVRKSRERGHFDYEWLKTFHTFSFGPYSDPAHTGFRTLCVLNEDRIQPGCGFPLQAHEEMEIFSIIIKGELAHQDNLGNGSILRPGQIQLMSAGRGITHTELNASDKEEVHFLQVWIRPHSHKLKPSYQEKFFPPSTQHNQWCLIFSSDGREGSLHIHQDVNVYLATLDAGKELEYILGSHRYGWIQIIEGSLQMNDILLEIGDGAAMSQMDALHIKAQTPTQLLFLDLG